MKTKHHHITSYVLVLSLFIVAFLFNTAKTEAIVLSFTNYFGIEMTHDEYVTLLNLGFNEDEIYYMDRETFEQNKDLDATLLGTTTKYYKTVSPTFGNSYTVEVTEEEYNSVSDIIPRTTVETTYKKMISTISANGNKYRFNVSLLWKSMPSMRSYDIIGIGFDNLVYISSSVYFSYTYADANGNYHTSTQYYNKKSTSTGGSAVYKLPTTMVGLSANLYYDVSKINSNSTLTSLSSCGDYSHATSAVPLSDIANYQIGVNGIDLDSSIYSYYDAIPCAFTAISVSW